MALSRFARCILGGESATLHDNGNISRDFVFIDDTVEAIMRILPRPPNNYRVINISSGTSTCIIDAFHMLEDILGRKGHILNRPLPEGNPITTWGNNDKLFELTEFRPETTLEEGLPKMVEWINAFEIH